MILRKIGNYLSIISDNRYVIENRYKESVYVGLMDIRSELLITIMVERISTLKWM